MNTIEIRDEKIDVEEIMRKIRENIRKRRESGAYTDIEDIVRRIRLSSLSLMI